MYAIAVATNVQSACNSVLIATFEQCMPFHEKMIDLNSSITNMTMCICLTQCDVLQVSLSISGVKLSNQLYFVEFSVVGKSRYCT